MRVIVWYVLCTEYVGAKCNIVTKDTVETRKQYQVRLILLQNLEFFNHLIQPAKIGTKSQTSIKHFSSINDIV